MAENENGHDGQVIAQHTLFDEDVGRAVATSLSTDDEYIVIGINDGKIAVFDIRTGQFVHALEGHTSGVWCLSLISATQKSSQTSTKGENSQQYKSSSLDDAALSSMKIDVATHGSQKIWGSVRGFGNSGAIVISGSEGRRSDSREPVGREDVGRDIRVWDVTSGNCLHVLRGHEGTVRCVQAMEGRPLAVSGSRDSTVRVWNIETGQLVHILSGHQHSVRCLDVAGNRVASGSYDATGRIWDVDTGECLHVLRGHQHQIYDIAFDGARIATGSLDSTVRVWDAMTGECLATLRGHTSLVGHLQLSGDHLITGGSDGKIIRYSLQNFATVFATQAHESSVTSLQFDDRFIATSGNDGRVKLWDFTTGELVRELAEPSEQAWKVSVRNDKCVVLCGRREHAMVDILAFSTA